MAWFIFLMCFIFLVLLPLSVWGYFMARKYMERTYLIDAYKQVKEGKLSPGAISPSINLALVAPSPPPDNDLAWNLQDFSPIASARVQSSPTDNDALPKVQEAYADFDIGSKGNGSGAGRNTIQHTPSTIFPHSSPRGKHLASNEPVRLVKYPTDSKT
ncbi:hypothetical protein CYMTET_49670 [Cymbomonas tetramitiformis]|uniref:Uncharacterized protein n=1 Tax=Cymbomonas tetramitiformis TaxID=36881 RepID=A0AAE0BPP3_9CHLO|nr:hypothetical protein CYMTET_49670 [Cymbomonas tetramitiformis]